MWPASISFDLDPGEYTLSISAYGDTQTKMFTMERGNSSTVNLADLFCKISVTSSTGDDVKNITYAGYSVDGTASYASSHTFSVFRASSSRSIGGDVNTPTPPSYSGASSDYCYTYKGSSGSITPSTATLSGEITPTRVSNLVLIAAAGTLTVPYGRYTVLVAGGGGSAGNTWARADGGGMGGEIKRYEGILEGSYSISLGKGGDAFQGMGGNASSFGTLISATGGSGSRYSSDTKRGIACGARFEGLEDYSSTRAYSTRATTGDIGGGGGSSGALKNSSPLTDGSTGGSYAGGKGGRGGKKGEDGLSISIGEINYSSTGGRGGDYQYGSGGGGGGGGLGANGGNGGNGGMAKEHNIYFYCAGGGGGGGGALGGTGGNGGGVLNSNAIDGTHGLGYGSGGGGLVYLESIVNSDTMDSEYHLMIPGGGGGGLSSTQVVESGSTAGAPGAVAIWWVSS